MCEDLTALSQGFIWQWHGDGDEWNTYEIDVNNFIETSFIKGEKTVKLNKNFPGYPYVIDFEKMLQINKHSKRKRTIRRELNANPYPVDRKTASKVTTAESSRSSINRLLPNLNEEVPGTAALEHQVNQYIRNVQNPIDCSSNDESCPGVFNEGSKHCNSLGDAASCNGKVNTSAASKDKTAALVNGKPWMNSWPPDTDDDLLKPVPGINPLPEFKRTKGWKKKFDGALNKVKNDVSVLNKYTEEVKDPSSFGDETCIICCELLSHGSSYNNDSTVVRLALCFHMFHKACLDAMLKTKPKDVFIQCPTCKKIHGEKCGIQPPGTMVYHVLPYSLPGYPDYETIRIIYDIRPGTQGPEHPNPGKKYTARGFPRHCYLPDNEMGRKILRLLVKAWNRRLIFTIGRSSTTGEENTVTWNEIHHKTEFGFNRRGHGYPDPNYFENILAELAAHGVVDDEVYEWYPA